MLVHRSLSRFRHFESNLLAASATNGLGPLTAGMLTLIYFVFKFNIEECSKIVLLAGRGVHLRIATSIELIWNLRSIYLPSLARDCQRLVADF